MVGPSILRALLPLLALGLCAGVMLVVWGLRARRFPAPARGLSRHLLVATLLLNIAATAWVVPMLARPFPTMLFLLLPVAAPVLPLRTPEAGPRVVACGVAMLLVTVFAVFASFSVGMAYAPSIVPLLLAGLLSGARSRALAA